LPTLATRPRVGPKTPANPQPTGVGNRGGSRGAKPPWRGVWGCAPFTPTEVSLFEKGRPAPTLIKLGGGGGLGDVPPQNKIRGQIANPCNPAHEWGPKRWQTLSQRGWANGGSRGAKPPWQGAVGGVPPEFLKRGRVAYISNPPTSGAQNAGKPSAHGGGQSGGSRGAKPPWRGAVGGCPSTKPAHEWDPKRRQTPSPRGWAKGNSPILLRNYPASVTIYNYLLPIP